MTSQGVGGKIAIFMKNRDFSANTLAGHPYFSLPPASSRPPPPAASSRPPLPAGSPYRHPGGQISRISADLRGFARKMTGKCLTSRRARIRGITGATVCCDWVLRLCAASVYCYCVRLLPSATARGYCVLLLRAATAPNPAAAPCCCCLLLLPVAAPWCYSLVPLPTATPCRCSLPLLPAAAPCCYSLLLLCKLLVLAVFQKGCS